MRPSSSLRLLLCLTVFVTSSCSSIPSKFEWHDLGPAHTARGPKGAQTLESWGQPMDEAFETNPTLAPGFLISMHFLEDSKLNGDFRIDFDGYLELPYDIKVYAAGFDLSGLKKKLTEMYRPYFRNSSDIKLHIQEKKYWLDVRGLVQKPGRYLLGPGDSLDQLIVMSGGLMKDPSPAFVRIQKDNQVFVLDLNEYYSKGEQREQVQGWVGGEIVFFQREISDSLRENLPASHYRLPVQVLGEVRKPGPYSVKSGMDFLDLVTASEGFTADADLSYLEVVRRSDGHERVFVFDWQHLERAPSPQEGDILLVHADRTTKLERRIQMAGVLASIISSIAIIYTVRNNNR